MYRRIISLLLCLALSLVLLPVAAFADEEGIDLHLDEDLPAAAPVIAMMSDSLPAKSAILMEQSTGKILHEQNADDKLPPASITKVMTLLLVMEALESGKITLEDMVMTSEYANSMGGSQIWLKVGEEMSVNDLLKAVAISSANDASVLLGEHVAGSNDAFVAMMNERAKKLGMENTVFKNATGLDDDGHCSTARDIALMSRELLKHPRISEYSTVWMDSLRGGETQLVNTNKLVRFYNGATGLKTGTTNGAGSCLSATATRDNLSLVAVVMGCPTSDDRFASARGLLDYGFANYSSTAPPRIDDQLVPVKVLRGTENEVRVSYEDPGSFVVEKGRAEEIEQEITLFEDVTAPIEKGQVLGKVEVVLGGEVIGSYNLVAETAIEKMTFFRALRVLLLELIKTSPVRTADKPTVHDPIGAKAHEDDADAISDAELRAAADAAAALEDQIAIETNGTIGLFVDPDEVDAENAGEAVDTAEGENSEDAEATGDAATAAAEITDDAADTVDATTEIVDDAAASAEASIEIDILQSEI